MAKKYMVTRGCTWCHTCIYECPEQAITMTEPGARIDQALCIRCGICYENCASEAIEVIEIEETQAG
jgi:hypothetical protein